MPDFKFRLDGLLRLRARDEDAAQQELAHARRKVQDAHQALDALAQARAQAGLESLSGREANVAALQAGNARVHHLHTLEAASREQLAALQTDQEERRQEALEAHRRKETLQRLHDRSLERYLADLRREEARRTDEQAAVQAARRVISSRNAHGRE